MRVTNLAKQGSSYCFSDNDICTASVGLSTSIDLVSCDEYPIASSEEGGGYFGTLAGGATAVSTLCVPVWQQSLQGNCNGLLALLSTNVAYFDDPAAAPNWQFWGNGGGGGGANNGWLDGGGGGWQRTALYPGQIPQAVGISAGTYGPNANGQYGSYFLRRKFTMGIANPSFAGDSAAWGAQGATSWSAGGSTGTNVTAIACAVNTFG